MCLLALALAGHAAAASTQPSSNVVVIPGFQAPHYPGTVGVPSFPTSSPSLSAYHFAQLAAGAVTPAALQPYDTIVLYGVRWNTLPASDQAAINAFALTGKVIIWDADATGSQSYATFIHPFSATASGEVEQTSSGGVVTFPPGTNPLASPNPSNPLYLDPSALTASNDLIEDMSVMQPGAAGWTPALVAANNINPNGGWVLAWGYGSSANQTGMVIYSGLDADAFSETITPNYAMKELAIEFAAQFQRSPASSSPPASGGGSTGGSSGSGSGSGGSSSGSGGGSSGGSGSSGLGNPDSPTFAACSFARRAPRSWVHGRVPLFLITSVAAGIHGKAVAPSGRVVGYGKVTGPGNLRLLVNTRKLRSNHKVKVRGVVYVHAERACTVSTRLKVDNSPPRLLRLRLRHTNSATRLTLRVNEPARVLVRRGKQTIRTFRVKRRQLVTVKLPGELHTLRLVLFDRANNRTVRKLR